MVKVVQDMEKDLRKIIESYMQERMKKIEHVVKLLKEREQILSKIGELNQKLNEIDREIKENIDLLPPEIRKAFVSEEKTEKTQRGSRAGVKIVVYKGREYNANYFFWKNEIKGGIEGLKAWAEKKGCSVEVQDNKIIIKEKQQQQQQQ